MSTNLARQLQRFSFHSGFHSQRKATLLSDTTSAAQLTPEDAYQIGLEGLEALCELDRRFGSFRSTLFFGVPKERQSKTENEILETNEIISKFLRLLIDYFNLPAATKALEHLVQNYKIHVFNVDDCVSCCLPYHLTLEFQNFISIAHLRDTKWHWLEALQKSKLPLPREVLVKKCISDQAIFSFICNMAKWSSEEQYKNERFYPFFAVLVCELLDQINEVSEDLMRILVSSIASGLQSSASQDFKKAVYMVIVQLCTKAMLSEKVISALMESVLSSRTDDDNLNILIIISHIYKTQLHFQHLTERCIKLLAQMRGTGESLKHLIERGLDTKRFLSVLFAKLVKTCVEQNQDSKMLLDDLVNHVPLSDYISNLTSCIFHHLNSKQNMDLNFMKSIMKTLDLQYPVLVDAAVDELLKKQIDVDQKAMVLDLFYGCPNQTLHAPMTEYSCTVLAGADAPSAEARKAALIELKTVMEREQNEKILSLMEDLLLRRLQDEDLEVACLASDCGIEKLPNSENLMYYLLQLLSKCLTEVQRQENDIARAAALRILTTLNFQDINQHATKTEELFFHLVDYLFPYCSFQIPISIKMGSVFGKFDHPLALMMSKHVDLDSFHLQENPISSLNIVLVKSLLHLDDMEGYSMEMLKVLISKCGLRVSSFVLLSLKQLIHKDDFNFDAASILSILMERMESLSASLDQEKDDVVIKVTKDIRVSYEETVLETLTVLLESGHLSLSESINKEILIFYILKLTQFDSNGLAAKAALKCCGGHSQILFLLNALNGYTFEDASQVIVTGLVLLQDLLKKESIMEDEFVSCVLPLLGLLNNRSKRIRRKTMTVIAILLQKPFPPQSKGVCHDLYLLLLILGEHVKTIEGDSDALISLLSSILATHEETLHRKKKRKTEIKLLINASASMNIKKHFLSQLSCLPPHKHSKELLLIIKSSRVVLENHELLFAAHNVIEFFLKNISMLRDSNAIELVSRITNFCTPDVCEQLHKDKQQLEETLCSCLALVDDPWNQIRQSALKLVQKKWVRSLKPNTVLNDHLLTAILKIAHKDTDKLNNELASEIASRWPLKAIDFNFFIQKAINTNLDEQEICLWMLEALQEKTELAETDELMSSLLYLLKLCCELKLSENQIQICRLTVELLENMIKYRKKTEQSGNIATEVLVIHLKKSTDPVLSQSVLSLFQTIALSFPEQSLQHVIQVLEVIGKQVDSQEEEIALKRTVEAIRVIVHSWICSGKNALEIWSVMVPFILLLPSRKRLLVCESLLQGMPNKAEGLSIGLMAFLEKFTQKDTPQLREWKIVASQLCQMVNLSDKNHALALVLKYLREQTESLLRDNALDTVLELTVDLIKTSKLNVVSSCYTSVNVSRRLGYNQMLIECVKYLSLLTKLYQYKKSRKSHIKETKKIFYQLETLLKQTMDVTSYFMTLVELLNSSATEIDSALILGLLRRRLNEIEEKSSIELGLSDDILLICPHIKELMESRALQNEFSLQLLLSITQQLVHALASLHPESFLDLLPLVSKFAKSENQEIRGSALACMAAFLREMGQSTLQHLPQFMPEVLESLHLCLNGAVEVPESFNQDMECSLELLSALIEGLGSFISPYLDQILESLLHPKMKQTNDLRNSIVETLPKHVPVYLLLPKLLPLYTHCKDHVLHLQLVHGMVSTMNSTTATQFLDPVLKFFFKALDIRQSQTDGYLVESHVTNSFICFMMKLNEKQFRPIFESLLNWAFHENKETHIGRQITCFRLFSELIDRLKSLFVGYYPAFLDQALDLLTSDKTKRKKHSNEDAYFLDFCISRTLYRGLLHANNEEEEEDIFNLEVSKRLVSILIKYIQKRQYPDPQFLKGLDNSSEIHFKGIEYCKEDGFSIQLVGILVQLGILHSTILKSLNHKLLKVCDKGSDYGRFLCLSVVLELMNQVREDYCILIPETIPPLSEMLEVDDVKVKNTAKEIIKLMESLTGDNLEQYF